MLSGEDIRKARAAVPMTQAALAGAAGVSERTVMRAERGDAVAAETVLAIRSVLGLGGARAGGVDGPSDAAPSAATPSAWSAACAVVLGVALAAGAGDFCAQVAIRLSPGARVKAEAWNAAVNRGAGSSLGRTTSALAMAFDEAEAGTVPAIGYGNMGQMTVPTRSGSFGIGPFLQGNFAAWAEEGHGWAGRAASGVARVLSGGVDTGEMSYADVRLAGISETAAWLVVAGAEEPACRALAGGLAVSDAARLRIAGGGPGWPGTWSPVGADPMARGAGSCVPGGFLHVLVLRGGGSPPPAAPPLPAWPAGGPS